MRRALLVSYYFPPRFSIGGKRAHRFARYLPEHGVAATVLTARAPAWERLDPSLDNRGLAEGAVRRTLLSDVEVARIPRAAAGSDGTQDAPTPSWRPVSARSGWDRIRAELRFRPTLGSDASRIPLLAARVGRAARAASAEVIFATGAPWEIVIAGVLAGRALRLPVVVDFRDPWSFGPLASSRSAWTRALDARLERAVLRRAAALTVTSEATRAAYQRCPGAGRVECVRTGFDPNLEIRPTRDAAVTLVHFGNCYAGRRLEPFLRALAAVARRRALGPERLRLLNLGRRAADDVRLADELGVGAHFQHRTVVPYVEGLGVLAGADLALLEGYGEGTWYLPGKLYDYLRARTPILATGASDELAAILARTGLGWAHARDDQAGLERRIEDALEARQRGRPATVPVEAAIAALSARATAGELARVLEDAVRGAS